jgi:hypothetical protein
MAKKALKAKSRGKSKKARSKVKKAVAKKPPAKKAKKAAKAGARISEEAVLAHVGVAELAAQPNTKLKAVVKCVNAFMDEHHEDWDDDLQGDDRKLVDDFQESPKLFLDEVNTCLETKGFTIFPVPDALLTACATKTIGEIKFEMNKAAKPKP